LKRGFLIGLIGVAACFGCGGSGSSNEVPLSSTVVQFQSGWTWTYNFTGTFTPSTGTSAPATGTRTITCSASSGTVTLLQSTTITSNNLSYNHTKQYSYAQDSAGDLTLTSITVDSNPTETVAKTTFSNPGRITSTTNLSGTLTFQDSSFATETYQVVGIQIVNNPVGQFATWEVARHVNYQSFPEINETEDLAPSIGEPVSIQGTEYESDGTVTGSFVLQSTNVSINTTQAPTLPAVKAVAGK
jgi:hypothetical protein